jgi:hypothetical protein
VPEQVPAFALDRADDVPGFVADVPVGAAEDVLAGLLGPAPADGLAGAGLKASMICSIGSARSPAPGGILLGLLRDFSGVMRDTP